MKKLILIVILAVAGLNANAQNTSASAAQEASLSLANVITISFATPGSDNIQVMFNSAAEMNNGIETMEHQLLVQSNLPYKVTMDVPTNFSYTGSATTNNVIPTLEKFKMKITDNNTGGSNLMGGGYNNVPSGSTDILTNCPASGDATFDVKYKLKPGSSYASGTYAMNIVYTATQL
jgi:hypothetical protein